MPRLALGLLLLISKSLLAAELLLVGNAYSPPKIYAENGQAQGILAEIVRYADEALSEHRLELRPLPASGRSRWKARCCWSG